MSRTLNHSHLLPLFHEAVRTAQGTNSALIMEHDVFVGRHGIKGQSWSKDGDQGTAKDYSIWLRWNQPCQGGEMRKYTSIHGDECTQTESQKPQDLHHPFPEGNPVAVGVRLALNGDIQPRYLPVIKYLFIDPTSPYRNGHGKTTFVENGNKTIGVIIENTKNVDPTVMVNLIQMTRSQFLDSGSNRALKYLDDGATMQQAVALSLIQSQYSYYFAMVADVRRILDSDPQDLSKGISFFDRGDYNRVLVHDLFTHPDKERGLIWQRDMETAKTTAQKLDVLMSKYEQSKELKEAA